MGIDRLMSGQDAIRLEGVVRRQGDFVLGPLNLRVPAGMVTGFVGPNGAGKTTAIKAMLGRVGIRGGSSQGLGGPPGAHQEQIGVVLDAIALPQVWNAISAARNLSQFYPSWDQAYFIELLDRLKVPRRVKVKNLSRGQGVKLQVALAMAYRPRLLILDEPTTGLDPAARLEVLDIFQEYLIEEGRTVLFSSHITSDLDRIADHLHVLADGQTCFEGPLSDVYEDWAMVHAPVTELSMEGRRVLVGARPKNLAYHGLIRIEDSAFFGPQIVIERPTLDEAVVCWSRHGKEW